MMNAFARDHFKMPLRSADLEDIQPEAVWGKLVREGKARKYKEGIMDRYVLVSEDEVDFDLFS